MEKFLSMLDDLFQETRKPVAPRFPYNEDTNKITLPSKIENSLRQLVKEGQKVEAVKRVTKLTGAGLRVSKDYVDSLVETSDSTHRRDTEDK